MYKRQILILTLSGSTLLLSLQAQAGPGAELYNELLEKGVIYPDGKWQSYVTDVGERLLAVSSHADRPIRFLS